MGCSGAIHSITFCNKYFGTFSWGFIFLKCQTFYKFSNFNFVYQIPPPPKKKTPGALGADPFRLRYGGYTMATIWYKCKIFKCITITQFNSQFKDQLRGGHTFTRRMSSSFKSRWIIWRCWQYSCALHSYKIHLRISNSAAKPFAWKTTSTFLQSTLTYGSG